MEHREREALRYQGFVKEIARSIHVHLSKEVELLDLIEFGQIGLLEALDRYDARRGIKFRTYAYYRIKGSMFDGLKGVKYNPRGSYYRAKCEQACADLMQNYECTDAPGSVQDELENIKQFCKEMTQIYILSLDEASDFPSFESPEQNVITCQLKEQLQKSIAKLSEKEAKIIHLYYYRGYNLTEVAKIIGIHRSWASKLHTKAIRQLYAELCQSL